MSEQTITHAYMYGNMHFLEASVGFRHVMKALYFEYSLRLAHDASLRMYENTHIHRSLLLLLLLILADDSVERQVHYSYLSSWENQVYPLPVTVSLALV